jgi:hypothetical protein
MPDPLPAHHAGCDRIHMHAERTALVAVVALLAAAALVSSAITTDVDVYPWSGILPHLFIGFAPLTSAHLVLQAAGTDIVRSVLAQACWHNLVGQVR